jgi:hypothetical protein
MRIFNLDKFVSERMKVMPVTNDELRKVKEYGKGDSLIQVFKELHKCFEKHIHLYDDDNFKKVGGKQNNENGVTVYYHKNCQYTTAYWQSIGSKRPLDSHCFFYETDSGGQYRFGIQYDVFAFVVKNQNYIKVTNKQRKELKKIGLDVNVLFNDTVVVSIKDVYKFENHIIGFMRENHIYTDSRDDKSINLDVQTVINKNDIIFNKDIFDERYMEKYDGIVYEGELDDSEKETQSVVFNKNAEFIGEKYSGILYEKFERFENYVTDLLKKIFFN